MFNLKIYLLSLKTN